MEVLIWLAIGGVVGLVIGWTVLPQPKWFRTIRNG